MTIEHMDNFSIYGNGGQAYLTDGVFVEAAGGIFLAADPVAGLTGTVVGMGGGIAQTLRYVLGGSRTKVGMAGRFYIPTLPESVLRIPTPFDFRNASNGTLLTLQVYPNGSLVVRSTIDETGAALAQSGPLAITANGWWHIEMWVTWNAGTGATVEVRVEGVSVISPTVLASVTAPSCDQVAVVSRRTSITTTAPTMYTKDLIIANGLGSFNNTFMGSCSVRSLIPDSDSAATWSRNTGATNFGNVNEDGPPNDDTAYMYAGTPAPAVNVMGLSNLPVDVTSVRGLMMIQRSKKSDGGDGNVQMGMKSGASTGLGADRPSTVAYTYFRDVIDTDPATAALWTPGAVNNALFQQNRTL